jgi:hypothetical protein
MALHMNLLCVHGKGKRERERERETILIKTQIV